MQCGVNNEERLLNKFMPETAVYTLRPKKWNSRSLELSCTVLSLFIAMERDIQIGRDIQMALDIRRVHN